MHKQPSKLSIAKSSLHVFEICSDFLIPWKSFKLAKFQMCSMYLTYIDSVFSGLLCPPSPSILNPVNIKAMVKAMAMRLLPKQPPRLPLYWYNRNHALIADCVNPFPRCSEFTKGLIYSLSYLNGSHTIPF